MATEHLTTGATRRAILKFAGTAAAYTSGAAIVGTGMALATQAKAETSTPAWAAGGPSPFRQSLAKFRAAEKRFNDLPYDLEENDPAAFEREEVAYSDARDEIDAAPVANWNEFADAFEVTFADGGNPNEDHLAKLLADVRRLRAAREA